MFIKYQHIERYGTVEVDGIDLGTVYVFPKIDGTNGSVWKEDGEIKCASRRFELIDHDNGGFKECILSDPRIKNFLAKFPDLRLFGEWLIPHSLKTYRPDAWRKFYIFDVMKWDGTYIPYDQYQPWLDEFRLEYITPICIMLNPTYEALINIISRNFFLIEDGKGVGEGIVLKNYEYKNRFGQTTWAKIVTNEFKEKNNREFGVQTVQGPDLVEEKIVDKYCTLSLVEKVIANITNECQGWRSQYIPRLLNTVYYDLIREECWNFVKEHRNQESILKLYNNYVIAKLKNQNRNFFKGKK